MIGVQVKIVMDLKLYYHEERMMMNATLALSCLAPMGPDKEILKLSTRPGRLDI